jgi:ATP-dependent DNA helicase RecQ
MKEYMQDTLCRAKYIGHYFGDEQIVACGICDLCLSQKKKELTTEEYKAISIAIENILTVQNKTKTEITQLIPEYGKEKIQKVLEDWGAEDKIRLTPEGKISLK